MRQGHYTLSDLPLGEFSIDLRHGDKRKKEGKWTVCSIEEKDGTVTHITCTGHDSFTFHRERIPETPHVETKFYKLETVPDKYQVICRHMLRKLNGHGGRRAFAGRPKSHVPEKRVRSFKLTDAEWSLMKQYLATLRGKDAAGQEE